MIENPDKSGSRSCTTSIDDDISHKGVRCLSIIKTPSVREFTRQAGPSARKDLTSHSVVTLQEWYPIKSTVCHLIGVLTDPNNSQSGMWDYWSREVVTHLAWLLHEPTSYLFGFDKIKDWYRCTWFVTLRDENFVRHTVYFQHIWLCLLIRMAFNMPEFMQHVQKY